MNHILILEPNHNNNKYPCPKNKYTHEHKTKCRGICHFVVSVLVFVFLFAFDIWNIVSISCLLSAIISATYHLIPTDQYYYLSVVLKYLDYVAISNIMTIPLYDFFIVNYPNQLYLYVLYQIIFVFGIDLIIMIYQYYHQTQLQTFITQFCHILNFFICWIFGYVVYQNLVFFTGLSYTIGLLFYVGSLFVDEKHKLIWAHHDTSHIFISIAYITHIYLYTYYYIK